MKLQNVSGGVYRYQNKGRVSGKGVSATGLKVQPGETIIVTKELGDYLLETHAEKFIEIDARKARPAKGKEGETDGETDEAPGGEGGSEESEGGEGDPPTDPPKDDD